MDTFIHSLFWLGIISSENILKSYLLFTQPVIFFITGASNLFSKNNNILNFYKKRLLQTLIPYWFYSLICIFVIELTTRYQNQPSQLTYFDWFIPNMQQWSNYSF